MRFKNVLQNLTNARPLLRDATASGNLKVLASMLGPAFRGLIQQRGKGAAKTPMSVGHPVTFTWDYRRENAEMARLYEAAKSSQWNVTTDIDWTRQVDPFDPAVDLIPDTWMPIYKLPLWG